MFSLTSELQSYWQSFIRLIYPATCALCETPLLLREQHLCAACQAKIELLKAPACARCARPFPPYAPVRRICAPCRSERPGYDRGFALVPYQDPVKEIFHQIKYGNKPWLLQIFRPHIERFAHSQTLCDYDFVVPIPMDASRERKREFNQAFLIAKMLPIPDGQRNPAVKKLLAKKRSTAPQSQLRRRERLQNLNGAFRIRKKHLVNGKRILLIDDVFTTGSTIHECAKLLKMEGASRVDFLTIARGVTAA